jgi:glycine amidinotransferase
MLSKNEWDPLEVVMVGSATGARIPLLDTSLRCVNYADRHYTYNIPMGPYPEQVIAEANEDLDTLASWLKNQGITVLRPDDTMTPKYYNYCPRDNIIVHDYQMFATPMPLRSRQDEFKAFAKELTGYGKILATRFERKLELYNTKCIENPDVLALTETEPAFDAANVLRANDDLFYLVSNSGNKKGAELLQFMYPDKKVHLLEGIYSYMHLDSTIAFLREGLMLLNPARIKSVDQLPEVLRSWDVIWCPEPVDIGHYDGYCNASPWINMNLLSVNPELAIIEERQENLRDELAKHGIESAMLPMRHARTLGGCFHCVTLDVVRRHE